MALESKTSHENYTTATIPDIDIETDLQCVMIDGEKYLIGKTGNVYHKDRYIVGVISDWEDTLIPNGKSKKLKFIPVLGYDKLDNPTKISTLPTNKKIQIKKIKKN